MEQGAQVRVTGPSRVLLALSTGALVAVTSVATAVVVLSGTAGVAPGQLLEPRPPAAAAPGQPPVVVLPPGALGTGTPEVATRGQAPHGAVNGSPRRAAASSLVLSLAPELSASVPVPAAGLLPPEPPRAAPGLALPGEDAAARPAQRRGALSKVLTAPLEDDATSVPSADAPSDSLSGTTYLVRAASGDAGTTTRGKAGKAGKVDRAERADADEAQRDRREFAAQERGRRLSPDGLAAVVPVVPAVPAAPAVPGVSPAAPAVPAVPAARPSPASVDRKSTGQGAGQATGKGAGRATAKGGGADSARGTRSGPPKAQRTTKTSAPKKKKASGSSSERRAPQGGRGSGRGPRS